MTWTTHPSLNSEPLPRHWPALRKLVLDRDGHRCTHRDPQDQRCPHPATDVDHITPRSQGGSHNLDNLQSLCATHHRTKTAAEGVAARIPRARPPQPHPGITD